MPELPEVESIRRQLAPLLTGRTIVGVKATPQRRFSRLDEAAGRRISAVNRRGKYLLLPLVPAPGAGDPAGRSSPDRELVMHLGMTGSFRLADPDPYVRATFHLLADPAGPHGGEGAALHFRDVRRFGRLSVVDAGDYSTIATLAQLGPEPLSEEFRPDAFHAALAGSRMPVKPYLLTQRPVAGVGNIYADEALWRARVNPHARRVGRERARALWEAIRAVLAEAIEREGTTFRDYAMVNGESGRFATFLTAYGQAGRPCARCGEPLVKTVLGGRGTTYCRVCQRR
ncbi:MAG TPA: bifunctional DNA-formamidopyrimidine glycosylase/DNA-(apurinic or apyrimidinic site) lyase [Egibacteraceae bacterium]|nr:bifunctional DNA-formamidopyrimidine glycosylase/DNA-(apurinic or apyrimidinic site) lyase [Egibacteraceae bacterium]